MATTHLLLEGPPKLEETWAAKPGIVGWLANTDHKAIGLRFVVAAMIFFVAGGIEAVLIRIQLAQPHMQFLGPEEYNQIFTMHGTTMMFYFAVPVFEGIALYILPLMLGTRQSAFPRMAAFAFYSYVLSGLVLYGGFFAGAGPEVGWFAFPTLTLREYTPSIGVDFWALAITLLELSALSMAVVIIVTIFKHRAPGMTIARMPVFAWAMLVFGFMIVFAMPTLLLSTILLELDRSAGTHFFDPGGGGDPLLWQHLFWWFGHPEVYIMFIPAVGIVGTVLPAFTRREIVGYPFFVLSLIATGMISFSVWAHHMFTTGLPRITLGFFAAATLMVAIPSGVQIFTWLASVWSSARIIPRTPFLFTVGFVITFVFGGLSGVSLAVVPFDRQVHDTFYVVAHFHYVLVGGMVFPLLAGLTYWFPKVTGRMLSERLGRVTFVAAFLGLNGAFLPMHLAGFYGMPRRVYTYYEGLGLTLPNLISTIGAIVLAAAVLLFVVNVILSMRRGAHAGADPWGANTLEWVTASPPPSYDFAVIPSVRSRNPLWAQPELRAAAHAASLRAVTPDDRALLVQPASAGYAHDGSDATDRDTVLAAGSDTYYLTPGWGEGASAEKPVEVELREDRRETPITTVLDARVEGRHIMPEDSLWPFLTAVAATIGFMGILASGWAVAVGGALALVTIGIWHWPEWKGPPEGPLGGTSNLAADTVERVPAASLTTAHDGPRAPLWWGMVLFITIEAVFFAAVIGAYYYLSQHEPLWPPGKDQPPDLRLPITYTSALLLSSVAMAFGDSSIRKGNQKALIVGQATALVLAVVFLLLKGYEFAFMKEYRWYSHAYGSLSWTMSGFHAAHVLTVVIKNAFVLTLALRGYFNRERRLGVEINGIYWHFVVLLWLPLFFTLYLYPWLTKSP